jgi:hypothetical protein
MTDDDYDTLSQKHLASIKRDMRVSLEDATVRATHKVMAELEPDFWALFDENQRLRAELKLNTTPPQQWVGLTDDEIKEIIGPWGDTPIKGYTRKLFDQIEAKLKEKNT